MQPEHNKLVPQRVSRLHLASLVFTVSLTGPNINDITRTHALTHRRARAEIRRRRHELGQEHVHVAPPLDRGEARAARTGRAADPACVQAHERLRAAPEACAVRVCVGAVSFDVPGSACASSTSAEEYPAGGG